MGCPPYFIPLKVGNYLSVCVSTEFELGFRYSVPFGGFETCHSGNPLSKDTFSEDSSSWPHECPHGYTRYFGGVEHGCDINICVKKGTLALESYGLLQPPKLPPFHVHHPHELNDTESLAFIGSDGNVWTRNWLGEWSNIKPHASQCFADTTTTQQEIHTTPTGTSVFTTQDQTTTSSQATEKQTTTGASNNEPLKASGPSTVAVTVPTVLIALLLVCVTVVAAVLLARRAYKHRYSGYNNIRNDQPSNLNTPA